MFKTIIQKIRSKKMEYMNRSPKGKWCFVRDAGIMVLRYTGVPVLDPNFEVYWWSYAATVVVADVTLSFIYSIWYYIYIEGEPMKGALNVPLYFGILIPSAMNYLMVMIDDQRKCWQSLAFFSGDKIYVDINKNSNPSYIRVIDESAVKLLTSTLITVGIVVGSMNLYVGFPVTASMFGDEIQLPIPVLFPFTDYKTHYGLAINLVNNLFVATVGLAGTVGIEVVTSMLKNTVWACTVAIKHTIDEISELLTSPEPKPSNLLNRQFRNVLIQAQDLDGFLLTLSDLYYWKFFLQPIFCSFSVAISIAYFLLLHWTSGIGVAFITYMQLYILCDIGNEAVQANEMLLRKFHELPWYLLKTHQQLSYAHLLNRIQNGCVFQMGPFAVLNLETLADMTNRIYSFLMMLIRFME